MVSSIGERVVWVKSNDGMRYIIIHFRFFPPSGRGFPGGPCSICFVCRRARTRFINSRSTLCAVLADVSKKSHPKERAIAAPSSRDTSRSYVLSHLLPTRTKMGLLRFTRSISCRKTSNRSNVCLDAIE